MRTGELKHGLTAQFGMRGGMNMCSQERQELLLLLRVVMEKTKDGPVQPLSDLPPRSKDSFRVKDKRSLSVSLWKMCMEEPHLL